jgi:uncharacterized delta-60 repeat protein
MSCWRWRKERFGGRARAAVTVAAVAVAVASLGTAALGSPSAGSNEGRSRHTVDLGSALAAGRDGKLIIGGQSGCHGIDFALARYNADGTLDRGFGTGGKVLTGFPTSTTVSGVRSSASAGAVAIQRDGKIVAAGSANVAPGVNSWFAIARYTVTGKLDRTFGRNGKTVTYFGPRPRRNYSSVEAVAIQKDDSVIVAGRSSYWPIGGGTDFALARYTPRGRLDPSFGRGGKVVTDFGAPQSASANAAVIQPNGKIVAVGEDYRGRRNNFALARYNAHGILDRSFGRGGRVLTKVGEGSSYGSALVLQRDGKLVAAGHAEGGGHAGHALLRYEADGELDPSFGDGGTVISEAGNPNALTIQRDRKLVTAGITAGAVHPKFLLARFHEDGSLDESFGQGGKVHTDFGIRAVAEAVIVRADGKIVVAGTVGGRDFALARYTRRGTLDRSFGSGGTVRTDFGSVCATRSR